MCLWDSDSTPERPTAHPNQVSQMAVALNERVSELQTHALWIVSQATKARDMAERLGRQDIVADMNRIIAEFTP